MMTRDTALWLQGHVSAISRLLAAVEKTAKHQMTDAAKHLTEARFACNRAEIAEIARQVGILIVTAECSENAAIAAEVA